MRRLAETIGVNTTTIAAMMFGDRDTEHDTVVAVADALGVDVRDVARAVGQARTEREPFTLPPESHLLSRRQRRAVTELVRAIAEERETRGAGAPAAMTRAGGSPAPDLEAVIRDELAEYFEAADDALRRKRPDRDTILTGLRAELVERIAARLAGERPDSARDAG